MKNIGSFLFEKDSVIVWILLIICFIGFGLFLGYATVLFLGINNSSATLNVIGMQHNVSFNEWFDSQKYSYQEYDITKEKFSTFSFENGIKEGNIALTTKTSLTKIKVGDIILYPEWGLFFGRVLLIENVNETYSVHIKPDSSKYVRTLKFNKESHPTVDKMTFRLPSFFILNVSGEKQK